MDKYISTQRPPAVSRGGIIIFISMCLPQNGVYSSSSTLISVEMVLRLIYDATFLRWEVVSLLISTEIIFNQ